MEKKRFFTTTRPCTDGVSMIGNIDRLPTWHVLTCCHQLP